MRARLPAAALLAVAALVAVTSSLGHATGSDTRLAKIGPAPPFALVAPDGGRLALADLRGKVVAVTFLYASCTDTCPLLTDKLVGVQKRLGHAEAERVRFVAITVDPGKDTSEALRRYAREHGAREPGFTFLTGTDAQIRDVTRRYGVYRRRGPNGDVDHTFLTSIVDADGILRVQYIGVRFDPGEFLNDIRSLLREGMRP